MTTADNANATKSGVSVSLSEGIQSYFDIGEHTISVWASAWSGREQVKVDDQIVVSTRNLTGLKSEMSFPLDGKTYQVVLETKSILRGCYSVSLFCGNTLIDSDEGAYPATNFIWRWGWKGVVGFFIGLFATGFVVGLVSALIAAGAAQ
ncbi:hypothetical protein QWI17_02500 [Gilvimarinus sp. SDUM040013]|uniref:Uncharacterized protein n=1 Tax=Gilvimarinus gilvus TaxID=3058038 RepID=A0ABU4S152_9GAMM|nr:hypothetical protein [Gilvimarinus sp. SDUM040013]MDO3384703.1 hypothetical protein [Gilvimarinus sp. SDUM040013]MDX6850822.1 hypothetical protein [Gilvimarinus sp. SDUM040013]